VPPKFNQTERKGNTAVRDYGGALERRGGIRAEGAGFAAWLRRTV